MDLHTFKLAAATPQRSNSLKSMVEFPYTPETPTAKLCQQFESVHLQTPIAAEAYLPTPQSDTEGYKLSEQTPGFHTTPFLIRSVAATQHAQPQQTPTLECLPRDLRILIFGQLSPRDLCMLSAVSRQCRQNVDDNELWQPHVQELGHKHGMQLLHTASLRSLYCDIQNRQRRYSRQRVCPQSSQTHMGTATFANVSTTPHQRALNLLSFTPVTPRHPGKENAAPFRQRHFNEMPTIQLSCPFCSASTGYPNKCADFAACGDCWHTFCAICLKEPSQHASRSPCNPRQYINPHETLTVSRVLQPQQPAPLPLGSTGLPDRDCAWQTSPGKRKAVPEPPVTSPNKRKVTSKQQAVQRLRRL